MKSINLQREPARLITTVVTLVEALIILAVAFGVDISPEQTAAITGAVIAVGAVISSTMIRNRVFAPSTVEEVSRNVAAGRDAGLLDD